MMVWTVYNRKYLGVRYLTVFIHYPSRRQVKDGYVCHDLLACSIRSGNGRVSKTLAMEKTTLQNLGGNILVCLQNSASPPKKY